MAILTFRCSVQNTRCVHALGRNTTSCTPEFHNIMKRSRFLALGLPGTNHLKDRSGRIDQKLRLPEFVDSGCVGLKPNRFRSHAVRVFANTGKKNWWPREAQSRGTHVRSFGMKENLMLDGRRHLDYRQRRGRSRARSEPGRKNGASVIAAIPGSEAFSSCDGETDEESRPVPIASDMEQMQPITVLVADDHPIVRAGLSALINGQDDMRVVTQAASGREAVEQYFTYRPKIALLDLRMSLMDGIEVLNAICERDLTCRVVIISSYQNEEEIYRSLRAGAKGYILKDAAVDEIVDCIRTVSGGRTWIPPVIGAKLAKRISDQDLTPREADVLHAVVMGKSNKEIGVLFNISEATVKVHMTHILEKLRVTGRTEAINVAIKRGLVRLEDSPIATR